MNFEQLLDDAPVADPSNEIQSRIASFVPCIDNVRQEPDQADSTFRPIKIRRITLFQAGFVSARLLRSHAGHCCSGRRAGSIGRRIWLFSHSDQKL